jgi:hypothetical protein
MSRVLGVPLHLVVVAVVRDLGRSKRPKRVPVLAHPRSGGIEEADLHVRRETRHRLLPTLVRVGHERREEQEALELAIGGAVTQQVLGHHRATGCSGHGVHASQRGQERKREDGRAVQKKETWERVYDDAWQAPWAETRSVTSPLTQLPGKRGHPRLEPAVTSVVLGPGREARMCPQRRPERVGVQVPRRDEARHGQQ